MSFSPLWRSWCAFDSSNPPSMPFYNSPHYVYAMNHEHRTQAIWFDAIIELLIRYMNPLIWGWALICSLEMWAFCTLLLWLMGLLFLVLLTWGYNLCFAIIIIILLFWLEWHGVAFCILLFWLVIFCMCVNGAGEIVIHHENDNCLWYGWYGYDRLIHLLLLSFSCAVLIM